MQAMFQAVKICGNTRDVCKETNNSLFKFRKDLRNVSLRCKTDHNV
jgi:hypothetical protein